MKKLLITLAAVACSTLLMFPAVAAEKASAKTEKAKTAEVPRSVWPPETLTGTISMVDPALRVVVVKDSSGIPFDIVVNRNTRIKAGDQELKLKDLSSDVNKNVSLRFVPERGGDVARSIQLNG